MEEVNGKISQVVNSSEARTNECAKKVKVIKIVSPGQRQAPLEVGHNRVRHDTSEHGALGDHLRKKLPGRLSDQLLESPQSCSQNLATF